MYVCLCINLKGNPFSFPTIGNKMTCVYFQLGVVVTVRIWYGLLLLFVG